MLSNKIKIWVLLLALIAVALFAASYFLFTTKRELVKQEEIIVVAQRQKSVFASSLKKFMKLRVDYLRLTNKGNLHAVITNMAHKYNVVITELAPLKKRKNAVRIIAVAGFWQLQAFSKALLKGAYFITYEDVMLINDGKQGLKLQGVIILHHL